VYGDGTTAKPVGCTTGHGGLVNAPPEGLRRYASMHSSLIGKVEKANRYARELDRITIDRLALTFRGDNDTHHVSLDAAQWHCTCHYFDSWQTCVHVLTLQKIMGVMLPEESQESIFSAQTAVPA
jgi:hypothetical protein